ncbi:MAG: DNA polymerase III subunit alpha [Actinobacteria bacterium]|nr:DNA polymerase III subunit alpha [Actinomycetota bacterium]
MHVHSEYSMMESAIKIKDLIRKTAACGMKSVALTDRYIMSGVVEFYREATGNNIRPIIGCEIAVTGSNGPSSLVLLARDIRGYHNLCRIVSASHLKRRASVPCVEKSYLRCNAPGLTGLCGSGCGEIPLLLKSGRRPEALQCAIEYANLFEGNFFIEIQRYPVSKASFPDSNFSEVVLGFALKNGLPVVATNNVHYLNREDYIIYRNLFKIKSMGTRNDDPLSGFIGNDEHYLKTEGEMAAMFGDIPEAIYNAGLISEKCSLKLPLGKIAFPDFDVPAGESQESYLKKMCLEGLEWRYGKHPPQKAANSLLKELEIIKKTGFCGYFLMAADMAHFAIRNSIPLCGKGSAAGSIVSYVLGISNVEPLKNNLYFERFLNQERKEPPDIDMDICSKRRGEILGYLSAKYGMSNIARVCTFSTLKYRAALREAGRILALGKEEVENAIKAGSTIRRQYRTGRNCGDRYYHSGSPTLSSGKILSLSGSIKDHVRHLSMHPSALIISNSSLDTKIPLTLSETGEVMSQYDMDSIEDMGLLKFDLINSLSLTIIGEITAELKEKGNTGPDFSLPGYDDPEVYRLIQEGRTLGVFQLESCGIRNLMRKIRPSTLNDITLLISLYRPGPQQSGMVKNFIERKFGREKTVYICPCLEPILKETFGIIVYQEQVMQIAQKIAGYSLSEADSLRKAMTGLSKEEMEKQENRFLEGTLRKGYGLKTGRAIFDLISKFASYGFVKAHAAAYAEISYRSAFLKRYYPAELLARILTSGSGYYGAAQYVEEARRLGIAIRLPHINKSSLDFTAEDSGRTLGIPLLAVKGLGHKGTKSIIMERERNGAFRDFEDFYRRAVPNCRITGNAFENLIKTGAFDFTGSGRKTLLIAFQHLRATAGKTHTGKTGLVSGGILPLNIENHLTGLIHKNTASGDFTLEEKLEMESDILGFCASSSPLDYFREELEHFRVMDSGHLYRLAESGKSLPYGNIFVAGAVINRRIEKTKDKKTIIFCTLEDRSGMFEVVFFPTSCSGNPGILMCEKMVMVEGRLHYKDKNISVAGKKAFSLPAMKRENIRKTGLIIKKEILTGTRQVWET